VSSSQLISPALTVRYRRRFCIQLALRLMAVAFDQALEHAGA
jgi:hypothetical protein